ncbi:hypothetical protein [Flexivirga caeni]|uniref:DUF3024 domain-containing protein n=1 Tax=Flexivirga caeni TaxID=2294115 RepID=A0A3M9MHU9_9MICO|nr:hypothetical protein [Flexivirga caeni]RNI25129.1 hypothetical protein EFY87_00280 [Flexivirga caeni]
MVWRRKIPETDVARLQRWCDSKVPPGARHEVRIEYHIRGAFVTLCESRPHWSGDGGWTHRKFFQLRYYEDERQWGLYYYKPYTDRWGRYARGGVHSGSMVQMLEEVDFNSGRIFSDRF